MQPQRRESGGGSDRRSHHTSRTSLTGRQRFLDENDIIVSKTDTRGILTYVNDTFLSISGYTEEEMLGQPHSVIRHPHMPRCVFRLLWDTIKSGQEIFAYVMNRCKNGDHYWVLAHVTPIVSVSGEMVGFHSNRRAPTPQALDAIAPLYARLLAVEQGLEGSAAMEASLNELDGVLQKTGKVYDDFVLSFASRLERKSA